VRPLTLVIVLTACSLIGCRSHAPEAVSPGPAPTSGMMFDAGAQTPAAPFDETPITPMETVGASHI
jgi:hypothetical protein